MGFSLGGLGGAVSAIATVAGAINTYNSAKDAKAYGDKLSAAQKEAARVNKELAYKDAQIAEEMAVQRTNAMNFELEQKYAQIDAVLGSQRAAFSTSGVVTDAGSALDVQLDTTRKGVKELNLIRYNGNTAIQQAYDTAEGYRKAGDVGLREGLNAASLTSQYWNTQSNNIFWGGAMSSMKDLYTMADRQGWLGE